MSNAVQPTGDQKSSAAALADLPNWVTPVQYMLTGFPWSESFGVLAIVSIIMAASSSSFSNGKNMANVASSSAPLILLAHGMMLTLLERWLKNRVWVAKLMEPAG